ncbi:MAG: FtsX-like permease family protein [Anaerolineaceae bacterium]|nr:FtsX-like permease family protein [Anaerolineaceae bacterium]
MKLSPRWLKVIRDLWVNRKRVLWAVLSVAVGVFAVGTVAHMYLISSVEMAKSYASVAPADIVLSFSDPFDQNLVDSIRRIPGVTQAEGRRSVILRFKVHGSDTWYPIVLTALPDYNDIRINKIRPETYFSLNPKAWPQPGVWPPPDHAILLERSSLLTSNLGLTSVQQNDILTVELPGGKQRDMQAAGLVYDFGSAPATFQGTAIGFVNFDALNWLGETRQFDTMYITSNIKPYDQDHLSVFAYQLKDRVERGGYNVAYAQANVPGQHPMSSLFTPLSAFLGILGLMALPLSGFLVINTISAWMAQQVRQIGVMKAIGGRTLQIVLMYMGMVFIFGVLSLIIAVPLAYLAAYRFTLFMASFANFQMQSFYLPKEVLLLELAVGLLVPMLAALQPVLSMARITVREAISTYGLSRSGRHGLADRIIEHIRGLPRPLLLSIRNTFRRKLRMSLTLLTLTLASALFISILSVWSSLNRTVQEAFKFYGFDSEIVLKYPYRIERINQEALNIPGVAALEGWGEVVGSITHSQGTQDQIAILGLPADSKVVNPTMIEGRWIVAGDENALVVTPGFLQKEVGYRVGDTVVMKLQGKDTSWHIVGEVKVIGGGTPVTYANYSYFTRVLNDVDRAQILVVTMTRHDKASQSQITQAISDHFNKVGIQVSSAIPTWSQIESNNNLITILVTLVMAMAVLIATVGGLGLTGLMSINVLERTREIGVMRAIGASHKAILQIFISEGLLIGIMSWFFGMMISLPLSKALSNLIGNGLIQSPLSYSYSVGGAVIWLVIVIVLSALATFMPAQDAARLTVRDVLAYE